ncbi:MAG: 3-hydroxybutyryl-CoA dehydrogenase [Bacteroidetes bacterium RIFCSPLOWO2_02_FULL_36_8]|nr:MAG: 3-hydroxybutyryl-CoA dehydrogenase [Bacteroidetes bacterium RIFCSPLOWO2_02_FULL_36_8]OFY69169.1 MAG: 3-hydroxybutyryl-CoA dehydrogenase [Bacteroidetes bacterium RIFCSPLOWO2_12_FULL_37_12]
MNKITHIRSIAIGGSGTMGTGIAQVFATAGIHVKIFDINSTALEKAEKNIISGLDRAIQKGKLTQENKEKLLSLISFTSDEKELKGDLILEAIVEDLNAKQQFFLTVEKINSPEVIFATNTSTIPVSQIAEGLKYPKRLLGMHFFNPAPLMKLVELISGEKTSPDILKTVGELAEKCGKEFVLVKDRPGFIVNRVARHYYLESLQLLGESACDISGMDNLLVNAGFKMGPFRLMDLIGNDVNYAVSASLYNSFNGEPRFKPNPIQQKMVEAGLLGIKTGKGFYEYTTK